MRPATRPIPCAVCGQNHRPKYLSGLGSLGTGAFRNFVRSVYPHLTDDQEVCVSCLSELRNQYISETLSREKGELVRLEQSVLDNLHEEALKIQKLDATEEHTTFGQRVADRVAAFGGSWAFILSFLAVLVGWIGLNLALRRPFDPYPFILLNLVLSCIAALQAPIIMMSQNRGEARDRMRAENDYRTNLMAEAEIRQLHQKVDHLLQNQWQRLMEIQQMQTQMMQQVGERGGGAEPR